jgi:Spy/CpxP family protein refolding chaperone
MEETMLRQLVVPIVGAMALTVLVAPPADARQSRFGGRSHDAVARLDLSAEQRDDIRNVVAELRQADATRTEIREAIREELTALGIEPPESLRVGHRHGRGFAFFLADLTEEQRDELKSAVEGMREADAGREDIRAAVKALLVQWEVLEDDGADEDDDAVADLAVIDADIQAAPGALSAENLAPTTWATLRSAR